jgi:hypothetical protein
MMNIARFADLHTTQTERAFNLKQENTFDKIRQHTLLRLGLEECSARRQTAHTSSCSHDYPTQTTCAVCAPTRTTY